LGCGGGDVFLCSLVFLCRGVLAVVDGLSWACGDEGRGEDCLKG